MPLLCQCRSRRTIKSRLRSIMNSPAFKGAKTCHVQRLGYVWFKEGPRSTLIARRGTLLCDLQRSCATPLHKIDGAKRCRLLPTCRNWVHPGLDSQDTPWRSHTSRELHHMCRFGRHRTHPKTENLPPKAPPSVPSVG